MDLTRILVCVINHPGPCILKFVRFISKTHERGLRKRRDTLKSEISSAMSLKLNCKDLVLKYLFNQNRPYSANDIIQNLNNGYSRANIQKALDELILEKKVREKIYGKQKVYSIFHTDVFNANQLDMEVKHIDMKIEETNKKIEFLEGKLKYTERELTAIEKCPSTINALKEKLIMEETVKKLSKEVSGFPQLVHNREEKNELSCIQRSLSKEYKKRKLIYTDAINTILENYPKKIDVFLAEVGIETI